MSAPVGVAEGSFGCVVRPVYKCSTNKKLNALAARMPVVGKLMKTRQAVEEELASGAAIRRLDPEGVFTLAPLGVCAVRARPRDWAAGCPDIAPKLVAVMKRRPLDQLVIKDGGADLYSLPPGLPLATLLHSLTPIIWGLGQLKARGVAHSDIKPDNIIYKDGQARLIDWGLSEDNNDPAMGIYEKWDERDLLAHTYSAYPPEFDALAFIKTPVPSDFKSDGAVRNTDKSAVKIVRTLCRRPECHSQAAIDDMVTQLKATFPPPNAATGGFAGFLHRLSRAQPQLWSKVDLYGLGITIGRMVVTAMPHHGLTDRQLYEVTAWIAAATHFNVFKRLTPEVAHAQWLAIWRREDAPPPRRQREGLLRRMLKNAF